MKFGIAAAAALLAAGVWPLPAESEPILLSLTGQDDASFSALCTLISESGVEERVELSGVVPLDKEFRAHAITCRIDANGSVEVTARQGSALSRSKTSGGTVIFTLNRSSSARPAQSPAAPE